VKQHDGHITVSSTPHQGSTFDIYLPVADTPHRDEEDVTADVRRGNETILVVEDDNDVRHMMCTILRSQGYPTLDAAEGQEAIQLYKERVKTIGLVIVDVAMSGRNGREILDAIMDFNPRVRSLLVSGYGEDVMLRKGVPGENVDFLSKPLSVMQLFSKVREILDR